MSGEDEATQNVPTHEPSKWAVGDKASIDVTVVRPSDGVNLMRVETKSGAHYSVDPEDLIPHDDSDLKYPGITDHAFVPSGLKNRCAFRYQVTGRTGARCAMGEEQHAMTEKETLILAGKEDSVGGSIKMPIGENTELTIDSKGLHVSFIDSPTEQAGDEMEAMLSGLTHPPLFIDQKAVDEMQYIKGLEYQDQREVSVGKGSPEENENQAMFTEAMTRPTEWYMGTSVYEIWWSEEQWNEAIRRDYFASDNVPWGHTSAVDHVISMRPGVTKQEAKDTLVHELLHTCFHKTGVHLFNVIHKVLDEEEYVVGSITGWLSGALQDERNRPVFEWLRS